MKFLLPILFALVTLPSLANAQQMLNIYCEECRDLTQHPEDARNFSYNQVFGTVQWLSMDQADRFRITDGFGNTVTIDINVEYRSSNLARLLELRSFDLGALGRLLVNSMLIQIRVIYPNLDIVTYVFTREDVTGDLPVGESNTRSGASAGGDGDDDDGFNDAADYDYGDSDDGGPDEHVCTACTLQVIYPDGSVGDPVGLWTDEQWEEIQEL